MLIEKWEREFFFFFFLSWKNNSTSIFANKIFQSVRALSRRMTKIDQWLRAREMRTGWRSDNIPCRGALVLARFQVIWLGNEDARHFTTLIRRQARYHARVSHKTKNNLSISTLIGILSIVFALSRCLASSLSDHDYGRKSTRAYRNAKVARRFDSLRYRLRAIRYFTSHW